MGIKRIVILTFALMVSLNEANASGCDPAAFREVVAKASASINELHDKNHKLLQAKLQRLQTVKGWTDADLPSKAAPFVKDDVTASLDAKNQELLAKVQTLQAGDPSQPDRCVAMVAELNGLMSKIVENTTARWDHMIGKASAASNAPMHAGALR